MYHTYIWMVVRRSKNILQEHRVPKIAQLRNTSALTITNFSSQLTMSFVESSATAGSEVLGIAASVI